MMDVPFLLYGFGLVAVLFAVSLTAATHADWSLFRAAWAVMFNWMVGTVFSVWTGVTDAWWFNIPIDILTAAVILFGARARWQVALVATYGAQIAMHGYYGSREASDLALPWPYYGALTAIAWLQLLLLIAWSAEVWIRTKRHDHGRRG